MYVEVYSTLQHEFPSVPVGSFKYDCGNTTRNKTVCASVAELIVEAFVPYIRQSASLPLAVLVSMFDGFD